MFNILVTKELPGDWLGLLGKECKIDLWKDVYPPPKQCLMQHIKDKDGALVTLTEKIDKEIIDVASKLKVISTYSVGYDHIDVRYAISKGIIITYTPEVLTEATADLIFGLILASARRIAEGDRVIRKGQWNTPWYPTFMLGREVFGKTIGIIGMGRIGKAVLRRAKGFSMRVVYYSRERHNVDAEYLNLDELLKTSDFVIVSAELNELTYHMINEDKLRLMKKDSFLINASRGKIVDEKALIKALTEGWIAGAGLDVFENEPLPRDSKLVNLENVVLTPHLGSATVETRERMAEIATKNLLLALKGEKPIYEVRF
ncbi:2-ketogluconate reductase [Candidatus Acidianus copahuensis]|uniref:2-ketogluconate reductase n=1 Tax=Candidatus Acidianus copahuensis TaxID=1160895 RepID=A0A031LK65_9CREN|nr:D-glycerate dehydrogenase [Candidatus Acidianus copahuensis]EZQ03198.1 2-ketogluconate reductase [Candidatus Acidianus copahuensis]